MTQNQYREQVCDNSEHANAKKILIVGPAWVGDMVMSQVLLKCIKNQDQNTIIDVIAPDWSRALLDRMPEVRRAISMPLGHGQFNFKKRYEIAKSLRSEKYSEAIVLPNSWKSALIPFLAGIPKRIGWLGEMRIGLLNDWRKLDKNKWPLMIERFAQLAFDKNQSLPKPLPYPSLIVDKDNVEKTLQKFSLQITDKPILTLCPGAEFGPAKRWPSEYYAEVAREKLKQGWQVWIFGSAKDQEVSQEIQTLVDSQQLDFQQDAANTNNRSELSSNTVENSSAKSRCIDLAGKTSLGEAIDLLSLSSFVVSNDSGLMHIAAALRKKLVVVYGSSDPRFTPPLCQDVKILTLNLSCSPCFQRQCPLQHLKCLRDLKPSLVLEALDSLS